MVFNERIIDTRQLRHCEGEIELYWTYTSGTAGNEFFQGIKESGEFIAAKCNNCGYVFFPPRMYCEFDFDKTEYVKISGEGYIKGFTISRLGMDEAELEKPEIYAIIEMEGTNGRIIHLLDEIEPEKIEIGTRVRPVIKQKEDRKGDINDILYFKPNF